MAKKKKYSNGEKFLALLNLVRPINLVMVGGAIIITILIALGELAVLSITIPAILTAVLVAAAGNALNDYYDIEIDTINVPERPLPSGKLTPRSVWSFATFLFGFGLAFSLFLPVISIVIAFVNSFLLGFYAYKLKKSGFAGNIVISYLVASVFAFGAAAVGQLIIGIILAIAAFFTNAAREVLKDMEDIKGDKMFGVKTLATSFGKKKALIVVSSFLLIAILVSPLPYLLGILSFYYMILAIIADGIFLLIIISLSKDKSIKNLNSNQRRIKIGAIIGLIAFLAGIMPF